MNNLSVLLLTLLLSSCANMHYGNFTPVPQTQNIFLAQEAASALRRVYPPARNTFCISQKIQDSFGMRLVYELRQKGYGIIENHCPKQKANFFYVVDEMKPNHLYRVSLYIGQQTLSRVYIKNNERLLPFSPWSHKD